MTLRTWIVLSDGHLYELSNMAFLGRNTLAMFDPYRASLLRVNAGCPKGFASPDVIPPLPAMFPRHGRM